MTSRLATKTVKAKAAARAEQLFRAAVITRDGPVCRCCRRRVIVTLTLAPNRLEVHHLAGRTPGLAADPRNGMVLCRHCHARVTGEVGTAKLLIVGARGDTFLRDGVRYIDASSPRLTFVSHATKETKEYPPGGITSFLS